MPLLFLLSPMGYIGGTIFGTMLGIMLGLPVLAIALVIILSIFLISAGWSLLKKVIFIMPAILSSIGKALSFIGAILYMGISKIYEISPVAAVLSVVVAAYYLHQFWF